MNSPNIVGLIRVYDNGQLHVDLPDGTIGCENWTSEQKDVAESVRGVVAERLAKAVFAEMTALVEAYDAISADHVD